MKQIVAIAVILIFPIITTILWLTGKIDLQLVFDNPMQSLSQILALVGFTVLSLSFVLITKYKKLEDFFGGLEKMYVYHQNIGAIAFVLILNHPLLLAINALPHFEISATYLLPSANFSYNLGFFSLVVLMLAFIFIYLIKLPYHIWLMTHRFLGLAFLLGGVHSMLIGSDISQNVMLKIWMLGLFILGTGSFILKIFLHKQTSKRYFYLVEKIERKLDILDIYLRPEKEPIPFQAGQFGFITFFSKLISDESHPFSFSSSPKDKSLRISVKILGDYTLTLPNLSIGDRAEVMGPHGNFLANTNQPQIWIAGGIGITPFLGILKDRLLNNNNGNINLFYCVRNKDEAIYQDELNQLKSNLTNFNWQLWDSASKGRISADKISEFIATTGMEILLCGPSEMMESLKDQFVILGVSREQILFENFKFI